MKRHISIRRYLPGTLLSLGIAVASMLMEHVERMFLGTPWIEGLVLAILIGAVFRTIWKPSDGYRPGIQFSAHRVLEVAVALMGATISVGVVLAAGPVLLLCIAMTVGLTILTGIMIGRLLRLPIKMAVLIACGNAICGNSAIAAIAPVIDAESDDTATAVAFTAVLGIAVVVVLPIISHVMDLSAMAGGILAGLTVYAVPQVLAAAGPMGPVAVQMGTLVKLIRVLMLGPVIACFSLISSHDTQSHHGSVGRLGIIRFLPPFILAFMGLMAARSLGLVPDVIVMPIHVISNLLTIVAMAGLGLTVDLRSVLAAGPRTITCVTLSHLVLGLFALSVIRFCCPA
ncbi:YeiH family protein [Gluconobacter morbifer]|nr:putative sulfate exporter family transporter [Gluconobacter morbifer]